MHGFTAPWQSGGAAGAIHIFRSRGFPWISSEIMRTNFFDLPIWDSNWSSFSCRSFSSQREPTVVGSIKGLISRGRNLPPGLSLPKSPAQQVAGAYLAWRNPRSGQWCGAVRPPPGCAQTSMPAPLPPAISETGTSEEVRTGRQPDQNWFHGAAWLLL